MPATSEVLAGPARGQGRHDAEPALVVCRHRTARVEGRKGTLSLARAGVAVRTHVLADGLPVQHRAVIRVHQVFFDELPVALERDVELLRQAAVFLPEEAKVALEVGDEGFERDGAGAEVDEAPAAPTLEREGLEAALRSVESGRRLHVRSAEQLAAKIVRPAVIGAGERARVAALACHGGSAVGAAIVESRDLAVRIPGHDDRLAEDAQGQIVARILDFLLACDHQPVGKEHPLLLEAEHFRMPIEISRRVSGLADRKARGFEPLSYRYGFGWPRPQGVLRAEGSRQGDDVNRRLVSTAVRTRALR